jgi:hypothetical protein
VWCFSVYSLLFLHRFSSLNYSFRPFFVFLSFSPFSFFSLFFLNSAGAEKSDHTDKKAEKDDFAAFEDF